MAVKALRASALFAAAWGLLSITLSGEISPAWLSLGWAAWALGLFSSRFPRFEAAIRRLETPAVLLLITLLFVDFLLIRSTLFVAITHFLLLFQSFKLIGPKERKDGMQIFLFAFFQSLAACTLSVDAWNAVILLALIPTAIVVLFWSQMAREYEMAPGSPDAEVYRHHRRMAALISGLGLPITLVLTAGVFVIFPRLVFNAPIPGLHQRRMGYSNQLSLSEKGTLEENSSVVLWMRFPKSAGRPAWDGYIRGDVLSAFNGHEWATAKDRPIKTQTAGLNGIFMLGPARLPPAALHQRITLAEGSASTLFAIDRPLRIVAPVQTLRELEGGTLHWDSLWRHPVEYDVFSGPPPVESPPSLPPALPPAISARVRRLTESIAGRGPPLDKARRIETYLQENYRYSTDFGDLVPEDPIDYFLFERRRGACGHFASAMAVMLRLRGIPSRVVAGYLQGEWNDPAQALVVRERDAHAWVEAFLPGKGWTVFDPTPARAAVSALHGAFFLQLRQYNDYLNLLWNQFVIQYDLYAQIRAFENIKGFSSRLASAWAVEWPKFLFSFRHRLTGAKSAADAGTGAAGHVPLVDMGLLFALSATGLFFLTRRPHATAGGSILFYARFLERMARAGHPKDPAETGLEFAERLARALPDDSELIARVTRDYYRLRFSGHP